MEWPCITDLDFPCIQSITLTAVKIEADRFAADLLRFPALRNITFRSCRLDNGVYGGNWESKAILGAIREHPNALLVKFDHLLTKRGHLEFVHDPDTEIDLEPHQDPKRDIERSLGLYLSKQGEWNDTLETYFPPI